jgi:hypothetical protein
LTPGCLADLPTASTYLTGGLRANPPSTPSYSSAGERASVSGESPTSHVRVDTNSASVRALLVAVWTLAFASRLSERGENLLDVVIE